MPTLEEEIGEWVGSGALPKGIAVNHPDAKATFWVQKTVGVTYYRATLPARCLPGKTCALNTYDAKQAWEPDEFGRMQETFNMPRQKGAAIWLFPGNNSRALLIHRLQEQGIPCFFECDDNYTIRPDVGKSSWLTKRERNDAHSFQTASDIARFCDGVICSTPTLADVYSQLNDNVNVCRNCIDPTDWDALDKPDDGILRLGWAASMSHIHDAHLIEPALRWLAGRPDVEIIMLGIQPQFRFPYTHIGWTDTLSDYRKLLQVLDVMLCPVRRTPWSDCKSDVKAMEGAMAGAMAVVSDSPSYDLWPERTFVCKDEKDWLKIVKHLYRNRDEVRKLQAEHRAYVLGERTIQEGVKAWHDALKTVPSKSTQTIAA